MFLKRRLFPLVSLVVMAVMAWWVFDEREQPPPPTAEEQPPEETDYYARQLHLLTSGADGRWRYRLEADDMMHYPRTEHWEFDTPRLELYTEDGANWYGTAERGRAWADGDEVLLQGQVRLWRPAGETREATQLDTAEVHLQTQEHYAETDQLAVLTQESGRIEGIGARAWLDEGRIELLSRVRAHYAPQEL
ncbi:LPS export ABC transporter periplasmic protein LptC [Alkalilimnicola ehrlichii]|uniref:Lipopolysaccharide export system protein LptC n=1 Tax=Alkalilimnicola ehrlichii TaxID=351052 RepID=A0A3E0WYI0_9GAMM|nr:LPS export ABC transporter periplasmic protein LptC [Alkalilimnicola ehrlichii]RFA30289.1 LPS export ABC transporter periplasmic protein LptC [Alkalilimnicola ehrlichii]RFA37868.1 LPS export ABC transporter periplasmic protein LptC [Alkalilimnicola ehrlichii]